MSSRENGAVERRGMCLFVWLGLGCFIFRLLWYPFWGVVLQKGRLSQQTHHTKKTGVCLEGWTLVIPRFIFEIIFSSGDNGRPRGPWLEVRVWHFISCTSLSHMEGDVKLCTHILLFFFVCLFFKLCTAFSSLAIQTHLTLVPTCRPLSGSVLIRFHRCVELF